MFFIRWSFCVLIHRIFVTKPTRLLTNFVWIAFNILIVSLRCRPFSKNWYATEPGTCVSQIPIVSTIAGTGVAIELVIWAIPIPNVWKLQMPRKKKIALTCVFGLGIIDIAIGCARLATVLKVNEANLSWSEVPALELIVVEPSVAIAVAGLCVCHPLVDRALSSGLFSMFDSLTSRLRPSTSPSGRGKARWFRAESRAESSRTGKSSAKSDEEEGIQLVSKTQGFVSGSGHTATARGGEGGRLQVKRAAETGGLEGDGEDIVHMMHNVSVSAERHI
ncbi:MAG: hypothetical protein M1828_005279 [Chrysothrix sp. TS-e1954]|nr:MAG: hypothetical protein M1828_005279 [Chrysothrix sp. TS-e1954]